jgi:sialate O-acetylesterase
MVAVFLGCLALGAQAFTVSTIYSDNMMLQRGKPIKVTGSGAPNETVEVTFDGETVKAAANAHGRWLATLAPREACKVPKTLTVTGGGKTVTFKNVLVGDVWVCSGQSNMHWNIAWGGCYHQEDVKAEAETNAPYFRGIDLRRGSLLFPAAEVRLDGCSYKKWVKMGKRPGEVSALGFMFGLKLSKACPDVPMAIISLAQGGSRIEPWIPLDGYDGIKGLEEEAAAAELYDFGKPQGRAVLNGVLKDISGWAKGFAALSTNDFPYAPQPMLPRPLKGHAGLYNHMMAPLETFPFKGVIWYQGESNEDDAKYGIKQRALITSWRRRFDTDMPFYFVQLPNFGEKNKPGDFRMRKYSAIRILQAESLDLPLTGMAVTTDTADDNQLHPKNKLDVADRLARMALNDLYGQKQPNEGRSPVFRAAALSADGKEIVIHFKYAEGGLANGTREIEKAPVLTDAKDVKGVVVTLANGREVAPESAVIDGEVFRISVDGDQPIAAVRYNCFAYPEHHVWSKTTGLPLAPFKTASLVTCSAIPK